MLLNSPNVDVVYDKRLDLPCINFKFKGKFTQLASELSTEAWEEAFAKEPSKFILIWDCSAMTGFEMSARKHWLNQMHQLHPQIDRIIVISDSILIRGAARLMLKLFQFKSEVYNTHREVWDHYPTFV